MQFFVIVIIIIITIVTSIFLLLVIFHNKLRYKFDSLKYFPEFTEEHYFAS